MIDPSTFPELGLNRLLVRNLERMGYSRPRPIQVEAIPSLLEGRDLIGLAQTGTGKTAAFAAPMLHHLLASRPGRAECSSGGSAARLRGLVLCPTRELAQQVAREATSIASGTVLRVECVYGKVAIRPQAQAIARGVDLLVATPGRLRDLLDADVLSLAYVRHTAIDEADRMLDMGFLPQVEFLLERVPPQRQLALFTATMPEEIERLAKRFLRDPLRIEVGRHTTPVEHVGQHVTIVDNEVKVPLVLYLLGLSAVGSRQSAGAEQTSAGREPKAESRPPLAPPARTGVLIFCRTKRRVGWVGTALARHGVRAGMIHGDRSQAQRQRALDRFARGELDVLVATDVAARGLHIPAVRTVINYDLPAAAEEYVHRVGRAAHGGGTVGEAFTLLDPRERAAWRAVQKTTSLDLDPEPIEGFKPPQPPEPSGPRHAVRRRPAEPARGESGTRPARKERPKRSRKSRPIPKGQKPGRGVIKLTDGRKNP